MVGFTFADPGLSGLRRRRRTPPDLQAASRLDRGADIEYLPSPSRLANRLLLENSITHCSGTSKLPNQLTRFKHSNVKFHLVNENGTPALVTTGGDVNW
jgi:hypothetical protein